MIEVLSATLEVLEAKACVYCEFYGSDSEEVLALNEQIKSINMQILDLMMEA